MAREWVVRSDFSNKMIDDEKQAAQVIVKYADGRKGRSLPTPISRTRSSRTSWRWDARSSGAVVSPPAN
jgi:hypothetical protein